MNSLASTPTPALAASGRHPPETERILFALSPREREIFLPGARLEDIRRPLALIDPETVNAEAWERTLREFQPTVLVTAWSIKAIPASWLDSESFSLRYVCHVTGSLSKIMTRRLFARGVRASNWGKVTNHAVAEHALLLTLALLRGLPRWNAAIAERRWTVDVVQSLETRSLRGRRVGLHGFGAIAREVIALLAPFRPAEIRAYSQGVPASFMIEHGAQPSPSLDELFSGAEVLIECESLTAQSRSSVDARLLGLLPDDGVFINVGRAELVDENALLREAASGRLRIGLDVFHREPLPPDDPLLNAPGVLASPHIAGPTWDIYRLCGDHALENLRRYLGGEPLTGEVTPAAFERMT